MKKIALLSALLIAAGRIRLSADRRPRRPTWPPFMPGGALLYLESPDFGAPAARLGPFAGEDGMAGERQLRGLLALQSLQQAEGVYTASMATAAGFAADLESIAPMAGTDSALALYDIRDVEFLYVTRLSEASLTQVRAVGRAREIRAARRPAA